MRSRFRPADRDAVWPHRQCAAPFVRPPGQVVIATVQHVEDDEVRRPLPCCRFRPGAARRGTGLEPLGRQPTLLPQHQLAVHVSQHQAPLPPPGRTAQGPRNARQATFHCRHHHPRTHRRPAATGPAGTAIRGRRDARLPHRPRQSPRYQGGTASGRSTPPSRPRSVTLWPVRPLLSSPDHRPPAWSRSPTPMTPATNRRSGPRSVRRTATRWFAAAVRAISTMDRLSSVIAGDHAAKARASAASCSAEPLPFQINVRSARFSCTVISVLNARISIDGQRATPAPNQRKSP